MNIEKQIAKILKKVNNRLFKNDDLEVKTTRKILAIASKEKSIEEEKLLLMASKLIDDRPNLSLNQAIDFVKNSPKKKGRENEREKRS